MTQQEFNNLSKRYLEGKNTEEEEKILLDWYKQQQEPADLSISSSQKKVIEKKIWRNISTQIAWTPSIHIKLFWITGIAASLILVILLAKDIAYFTSKQQGFTLAKANELKGIEVKNTTVSNHEVILEDGTIITLRQNSSIIYDKSFNKIKREVYLKGSAFFKVKRDITKPFVVHTGTLVTEVLGTSFNIKQNPKGNTVEVAVKTGRVSVYTEKTIQQPERNGVVLTPNQRVVFDEISKNITTSIIDNPIPLTSNKKTLSNLVFKTTSLQTVLNKLSELYGIEFIIVNPNARRCRLTADLNGLSMFTQLNLICKSIDASYEKRGTVVFIYGDGC